MLWIGADVLFHICLGAFSKATAATEAKPRIPIRAIFVCCCARRVRPPRRPAAGERDELAPVVIELHTIPHDERGRTAGYRIGGDPSAGSLPSPDDQRQVSVAGTL
jgi:hypothetical protein